MENGKIETQTGKSRRKIKDVTESRPMNPSVVTHLTGCCFQRSNTGRLSAT
jgi:hypothetical protein